MSTITPPPVGGDEVFELTSVESVDAFATDYPEHDDLLLCETGPSHYGIQEPRPSRAYSCGLRPFTTSKAASKMPTTRTVIGANDAVSTSAAVRGMPNFR